MKESPGNSSMSSVCVALFFFSAVFPNTPVPLVFCMQMKKGSQKEYTNDSSHFCALLVYIFSCRSWPVEKLYKLLVYCFQWIVLPFFNHVSEVGSRWTKLFTIPLPPYYYYFFFNFLFSVFFTVFVSLELCWLWLTKNKKAEMLCGEKELFLLSVCSLP